MAEINANVSYSFGENEPDPQSVGAYTSAWIGNNQHFVKLKKLHKILSSYSWFWFVYGKTGSINIFEYPNSLSSYFIYKLKDMKYISIDKTKIRLWNNRKNFKIKFMNEKDKIYFDNAYIKCVQEPDS